MNIHSLMNNHFRYYLVLLTNSFMFLDEPNNFQLCSFLLCQRLNGHTHVTSFRHIQSELYSDIVSKPNANNFVPYIENSSFFSIIIL